MNSYTSAPVAHWDTNLIFLQQEGFIHLRELFVQGSWLLELEKDENSFQPEAK